MTAGEEHRATNAADGTTRRGRRVRVWLALLVAAIAVAAPVAWYLISPFFIDQRVDEGFPIAAVPSAVIPAGGGAAVATPALSATPATTPTPTPVTSPPAGITAPASTPVIAAPIPTAVAPLPALPTPTATIPPSAPAAAPTVAPAPVGPIVLGSGEFGTVDAIHKGSGTATIHQLPDGRRILRLEGFSVTNGPDLYVYLSGHPAPRSSGQVHEGAGVEIARLKGNVGDQNYELPAALDLTDIRSVVIYCKRFTTVFSTATLGVH